MVVGCRGVIWGVGCGGCECGGYRWVGMGVGEWELFGEIRDVWCK